MSTRDYKHAARPRGEPKRRAPKPRGPAPRRWPWFAAGFACGLLVAFLAYLKEYSPETLKLVASQSALRDEAQRHKGAETPANGKPRFEFYTLLPEMEVAVPEKELQAATERARRKEQEQPAPKPAAEPAATAPVAGTAPPAAKSAAAPVDEASEVAPAPGPDTVYMIQAASFKRIEDADRLKANLALMGMVANIQTVSIDGDAKFFRVRVGPYTDITRLNDARTRLREQNLEPLVLKIRG